MTCLGNGMRWSDVYIIGAVALGLSCPCWASMWVLDAVTGDPGDPRVSSLVHLKVLVVGVGFGVLIRYMVPPRVPDGWADAIRIVACGVAGLVFLWVVMFVWS